MLKKLLKYDLRANMKIFLFVWPAIVLFALLERLAISAKLSNTLSSILVNTTTTLFVLAVIAACVFALVISVMRFYSGLLRDEGYLMFTLPVKPWQLVLSKLLTAMLTITVTILLSIVSVVILFTGVTGFVDSLRDTLHEMSYAFNTLSYILLPLLCICSVGVSILQIYLACTLGHLFRKHRVLFSVLCYYGISVALETIFVNSMILLNSFGTSSVLYSVGSWLSGLSMQQGVALMLGCTLAVNVVLGCIFFFVSEWILRKRLNLE